MTETPSSNALIYAILALNSEIVLQKDYLSSFSAENERDEDEEVLDDLEQAFMELIDLYKKRYRQDKNLPNIDELLNNEL